MLGGQRTLFHDVESLCSAWGRLLKSRSKGDPVAPAEREQLILDNLPLVGYLARKFRLKATHISREELASAGAVALILAVDAYDPEAGVPFGSFARLRILGAFMDEMRAMDWATRGVRRRGKAIAEVEDTLTQALGRKPSEDEIATSMGTDAETVRRHIAESHRSVSVLDDTRAYELPSTIIFPEEAAEIAERRDLLRAAVDALPGRMAAIVRGVYIEERTVTELAAEFGISHAAVSQQRAEALRLLQDAMQAAYEEAPAAEAASRLSERARNAYLERFRERQQTRRANLSGALSRLVIVG